MWLIINKWNHFYLRPLPKWRVILFVGDLQILRDVRSESGRQIWNLVWRECYALGTFRTYFPLAVQIFRPSSPLVLYYRNFILYLLLIPSRPWHLGSIWPSVYIIHLYINSLFSGVLFCLWNSWVTCQLP